MADDDNFWFVLGMTVGTISVFVSSFGETLLRLSALRAQRVPTELPPFKRPLWLVGLVCTLLGAPLDTVAGSFVSLTMVIILLAAKQPVLAVFARLILSERISATCTLGILGCAGGSAIALLASPPSGDPPKFESPADFFTTPITIYLAITLVCMLLLWFFIYKVPARVGKGGVSLQTLAMPLLSAWLLAASKLFNVGLGRIPEGANLYDLQWVWMPLALFGMAGGVLVVNIAGLERMSTHIFMPITFGFFAVIMGVQGFLLGEFEGMSQAQVVQWILGMAVAMGGTALVALGSPKADEDVQEQEKYLEDNQEFFDTMEAKISMTRSGSSLGSRDAQMRLEVGREMF